MQPLARAADGRRGDGRLRSAQHAVGERGRDAERVVGQPLDRGRVQVDPAMEQPGQRHAGPGAVAGQLEAAIQHAQAHDAQRLPFQRRHRIGQHLARVAARPVRGLAAQPVIGMARRGGDGARLQDPETLAVPGPFQVVALRRVVQRAGRVPGDRAQRFGLGRRQRGGARLIVPRGPQAGALAVGQRPAGLALGADPAGGQAPRQRRRVLPQPVLVALGLAADQRLAQAPVGVDQHLVMASADRIAGEGDARDARLDQWHDHHGHAAVAGQSQPFAIGARLRRGRRVPDAARAANAASAPRTFRQDRWMPAKDAPAESS